MSKQRPLRKEILKVTNNSDREKLLCVEPIGDQVQMKPGKSYEVRIVGGDEGPMELFVEEDKLILYGWNNSDSAVYLDDIRVAGMELPSNPQP